MHKSYLFELTTCNKVHADRIMQKLGHTAKVMLPACGGFTQEKLGIASKMP